MEKSEKLDKLAPALAKAQAEMGGAIKESNNPFFKKKYADLSSVWKACKDALHNNGLSVIQSPITDDTRIGVTTMLLHDSGQFVTGEYTIGVKKKDDPQADGSSITYARRYALAAFVGVCPVDDDAESAMFRGKKKQPDEPTEADANYELLIEQVNNFEDHAAARSFIDDRNNIEMFQKMLGKDSPQLHKFSQYCSHYLKSLRETA